MRQQSYLYRLAHTYHEFRKGRASEMECLNMFLESEEAGNTRRSLNVVLHTVDLLQGRTKNETKSEDGRNGKKSL